MNIRPSIFFNFIRTSSAIATALSFILFTAAGVLAQLPPVKSAVPPPQPEEDYTWWYVTLFVLGSALAAAVYWMIKTRKAEREARAEISKKEKLMSDDNAWDSNSFDADKEMEWYRQQKKSAAKSADKTGKKNLAEKLPKTKDLFNRHADGEDPETGFSEKEFQQKLQVVHFNQLPIFKIRRLEPARPFSPLSISNDESLMSAIEQTHDEYEEDEEVRDLSVRILTRFKTRNSIEALSQVALYDLSSNLRSKAVSILADFDHESVFEAILLCCADPTREVRAAAARGLFRLSFDRADAWTRIAETRDEYRMRQAILAAKEADLVKRSFDRLVHSDQKIAYEAVTLLVLMISAGQTEEIFKAIDSHPDDNVKLALLHVIGLAKEEETIPRLQAILDNSTISMDLKKKIEEVIHGFEMIAA